MADEFQRSQGGIIILTEDNKLYFIPSQKLNKFEYKGDDKDSLIDTLIKTGRLKNLKAARQVEASPVSQDVTLFGGTFPIPE